MSRGHDPYFTRFWQVKVTEGLRLHKLENNGRRTINLDIGSASLKVSDA